MPFNSFLNYPMSWKPERSRLKRPVYLSLAEQLEKDIAAGFLPPGTRAAASEGAGRFSRYQFYYRHAGLPPVRTERLSMQ